MKEEERREKQKAHEELILGVLFHYPLMKESKLFITPEMFQIGKNQDIYNAMLKIDKAGEKIDMATVMSEVKDGTYLSTIFASTGRADFYGYAENFKKHLLILAEYHMINQSLTLAESIKDAVDKGELDSFEILELIQKSAESIKPKLEDGVKDSQMLVEELYKAIEHNANNEDTGVKIGFKEIDNFTNGFQRGDLIVLAGHTSMGKTSMMISQIVKQIQIGQKVGIWSLEMTSLQLTGRIMSQLTGLSSKHLTMGKLSDAEYETLHNNAQTLIDANVYIIESKRDLNWIEASITHNVEKYKLDGVYIDYLQLMGIRGLNKRDAMGECANSLKVLAKSLRTPIHLGSQFKRATDGNNYPTLDMLKESGDIENAADVVAALWRPEYYKIEEIDFEGGMIPAAGLALYIILKGRNIGLKRFKLRWTAEQTLFEDWEEVNPFTQSVVEDVRIDAPNKKFDDVPF